MATFDGWNILPMPSTPVPTQMDFEITDAVSITQSPFTMQSQFQAWPGAEQWTCNVSLPPMSRANSNAWVAWLMSLQGILNVFQMGDSSHLAPTGTPLGTPLVDGTIPGNNLPASSILNIKGWTPSKTNLLLPGDYIQIGYRLHRVLNTVNSTSGGLSAVNIWPSIREQPADGTAVILNNTQGLWRLSENKRTWTERPTKVLGLSFKAMEAR